MREFQFTIKLGPNDEERGVVKTKSTIRTVSESNWYDVPLAAVPVIQVGWPDMPEYMDGRQYFLWWKNNFKEEKIGPVIHNPFPKYDNVKYEMGGESARRWGA